MPQLVKGGKWVFGWVVVGQQGELPIPPEAWAEYGFQAGDEVIFLRGSRRSGGLGLSHARLLAAAAPPSARALAGGRAGKVGQVVAPPEVGLNPGDLLLAVRGSGRALGLVTCGPIFEEALRHLAPPCFPSKPPPTG